MSPSPEAIAVAAILMVVIAAYALFGGADFGGGIWDLLAGNAGRGAAPRELIDESITPVWEANHVWLVFVLVLLWTAFPPAFAAIMTALFVPLSLSALGIVLRGVGFAFRHTAQRLQMRQLTGAVFAGASLITPFFLGTAVGAVVTGQVPVHPAGNVLAAWTSPTAILTGFLFVAACAYISAVFLVLEARQRGQPGLTRYFSLRATAAGVLTGALAGATFGELSSSSPYVYNRLTGIALPLVAISVATGISVLGMLWLRWHHALFLRITAAIAVATVVWGWGLAQYPYLFPISLTIAAGSAPTAALVAEFVVAGLAVLLVAPAFGLLYYLQQRRLLTAHDSAAELRLAARLEQAYPGQPVAAPASAQTRMTTALVLVMLAIRAIRDALSPARRGDRRRLRLRGGRIVRHVGKGRDRRRPTSFLEDCMGEQTEGRHADLGQRFTDRGERFGRRRFLRKAGIGALAVGAGGLLAGCHFDDGAYQGRGIGQSSTSGQTATPGATNSGQGGSSSQSGMSS